MSEVIKNRYDFTIIFDVENGNPNGDPDAGNMPRTDAETGHGIVTDVCLKRKIRNYVELVKNDEPEYKIFIKEVLNDKLEESYADLGFEKKGKKQPKEEVEQAQKWMCGNYYDVRTFGAVMNTGDAWCGIIRGPVQLGFGKSIEPVVPQEITITRQAITKSGEDKETEMGKKSYIPYGLYKAEGFISAALAEKTGFSESDLELLWTAIENMFEHDRSAARGKMIVRKLVVFKHESVLGNAPSHKLLDRVKIARKGENSESAPARQYDDYEISVDMDNLPEGIVVYDKV